MNPEEYIRHLDENTHEIKKLGINKLSALFAALRFAQTPRLRFSL